MGGISTPRTHKCWRVVYSPNFVLAHRRTLAPRLKGTVQHVEWRARKAKRVMHYRAKAELCRAPALFIRSFVFVYLNFLLFRLHLQIFLLTDCCQPATSNHQPTTADSGAPTKAHIHTYTIHNYVHTYIHKDVKGSLQGSFCFCCIICGNNNSGLLYGSHSASSPFDFRRRFWHAN